MTLNRRELLDRAAAITAGALATGYTATARGYRQNETIQVGAIGTGGRCQRLLQELGKIEGVRITAVADVWDNHLQAGKRLADPQAFATKDFRALLDRSDVDAVVIGAPDHWHVPLTVAACQAGKDVYVEKPLTHNLEEGAAAIAAQNEHKRVVQVGMQQRSMPQFQTGFELINSGALGKVHRVHLSWNRNADRVRRNALGIEPASVDWPAFLGNAPQQPFDEYRFRNWRWFWDFGGGILTDLMVHFLDVANWYLGLRHPAQSTTIGQFCSAEGIWETPDTVQTLLNYPDRQVQVFFEGTFFNAREAAHIEFMGTDASLYLDRGRFEMHPERKSKQPYREEIIGKGSRGADFYLEPNGEALHLANWLSCIRSRQTPTAPAEAGVDAVLAAHLANQAYRTGKVVEWKESA